MLVIRGVSLLAFFILAVLGRATIPTLLITEGLAMAMVVLLWLHAWRLEQPGVGLVLIAIGASLLAAVVRGSSVHVTLAWEFDSTALYHLAQMPGIILLYVAVKRLGRPSPSAGALKQSTAH